MRTFLSALVILTLVAFSVQDEDRSASPFNDQTADIIVSVDEWDVPFDDTRSRDPFVAPDGTIFFAGQRADYIGYFNTDSEEFDYHELEDGAGPHTVVVAEDGTVWYAGNRARHIGQMDAATGEITKYEMEDDHARDPHTFAFDSEGNIWFTAQGGNGVGYFDVSTGEAEVIPVPTEGARPYGIVMDPDNERPWIALFGTNKIATVDPETMELEEIELPREEIRPRRLDVTSDGNVWYGDYATGHIGRYNPEDGSTTEWEMPDGGESQPYAVRTDDQDRVWFSASGLEPNKLVAFDTRSEEFVASREIESASGAIRNVVFDDQTRSIWFGTDTGHIGRAVID